MRAVAGAALVAVAVALAGCGFRPMYGEGPSGGGAVPAALSQVETAIIADRTGQLVRTFLQNGLTPRGMPGLPLYRLDVTLDEQEEEIAFRRDETATRIRLHVLADFTLVDAGTGRPLHGGRSRAVTSYNILDDYYATIVAEEQARRVAAEQIARDIRTRLAVYFERNPGRQGRER
ncbi:MAG: LPS assembly lipoprotein LptE [Acetobacterales bacterium]